MNRQSKGAAFELSIRGDELENDRIMLEHNLQNTELSFRLSSTSDEEDYRPTSTTNYRRHHQRQDSSVEYPRHLSEPSLPEFPSFAAHHRSRDDFGGEDELSRSHAHGWSYRTHDDDEGINPYGAHSMSTAAHHASALTLSAGLGGGRAARRDISLSGAEYDPDRPLHAIMAGVNSKQHSMFDLDPTKTHITHEPIVVDSTAELDRILESGHAQPPSPSVYATNHNRNHGNLSMNHSNHPLSPISSSSPSASDSDGGHRPRHGHGHPSPRPRLSDHLRHVSFSPKRPQRSVQSSPGTTSPLRLDNLNLNLGLRRVGAGAGEDDGEDREDRLPTPRAATRRVASGAAATQKQKQAVLATTTTTHAQPDVRVNVHPATPSSAGSRFTRMARGITRELEATQMQLRNARNGKPSGHAQGSVTAQGSGHAQAQVDRERNPFHEPPPPPPVVQPATARRPSLRPARGADVTATGMGMGAGMSMSRVHLPDITGLTAAVESPARPGVQYQAYRGDLMRPRESEVRLVQTLAAVQGQLEALEEENGISRRRVRELEMELEACKREVARERTRLFEREREKERDFSFRQNQHAAGPSKGKAKGKEREISEERMQTRYKEAVSEKKALEALITSLRSHLTRLTSELTKHSELLAELRALRDGDASGLREKGAEILRLREEVQRLAGEVEVLRGVVEEGLKERRASREEHEVELTREDEQEEAEETFRLDPRQQQQRMEQSRNMLEEDEEDAEDEDYVPPSRSFSRASLSEDDEEEMDEEDELEELDDEEPEPFDPDSLSSPINRAAERTMRTDRATVAASSAAHTPALDNGTTRRERRQRQIVDENELSIIAAELEERRANRSNASISIRGASSPVRRRTAPMPMRATVQDASDDEGQGQPRTMMHAQRNAPPPARPSAPTPGHATRRYGSPPVSAEQAQEQETPFPQIRGERLERLFFSAPEHNARTCTVCDRRRRPGGDAHHNHDGDRPRGGHEEDEGYEGSEGADAEPVRRAGMGRDTNREREEREAAQQISVVFSTDPAHWQAVGRAQGLPAQTVVARVVRELEDDFTHYKSIYVELADQYKVMDAASDVRRRNTLAKHLREVVDVLELKGDKIAALYDLLRFKERSM